MLRYLYIPVLNIISCFRGNIIFSVILRHFIWLFFLWTGEDTKCVMRWENNTFWHFSCLWCHKDTCGNTIEQSVLLETKWDCFVLSVRDKFTIKYLFNSGGLVCVLQARSRALMQSVQMSVAAFLCEDAALDWRLRKWFRAVFRAELQLLIFWTENPIKKKQQVIFVLKLQ